MSDLAGVNPQRTPGASFSRKDGSKDVPGRIYLGAAVIHFIHIPHVNFIVAYSDISIVLRGAQEVYLGGALCTGVCILITSATFGLSPTSLMYPGL
jgi:hypothetical protein